jgi:hypothetical protein
VDRKPIIPLPLVELPLDLSSARGHYGFLFATLVYQLGWLNQTYGIRHTWYQSDLTAPPTDIPWPWSSIAYLASEYPLWSTQTSNLRNLSTVVIWRLDYARLVLNGIDYEIPPRVPTIPTAAQVVRARADHIIQRYMLSFNVSGFAYSPSAVALGVPSAALPNSAYKTGFANGRVPAQFAQKVDSGVFTFSPNDDQFEVTLLCC